MSVTTQYGFIGLGDMGGAIALRLHEKVVPLRVHDANPDTLALFADRGLPFAASVEALAATCDVIFTCLPTPAVSRMVAGQIAHAAARRCAVQVEMSTVGVQTIRDMAADSANFGVSILDAPVSGGPRAVPEGLLTCLASGPPAAVERARPAFDVLAGQFFVLGDAAGLAQAMKVGNNLMAACNLAVTSEVLVMLKKAGIDPETAIEVLNVSTGRNRASELLFPTQILTGNFAQGARLDILAKDTQLAVQAAHSLGASFALGSEINQAWQEAAATGFGAQDITAIYKYMETRTA